MEDYIQPLYPEDDLIETEKYLIIRTFPDFLAARLAAIPAAPPGEVRHNFDPVYDIPNLHELDKTQKGRMVNLALWVMNDAKRDSMMRIMKRWVTFPISFLCTLPTFYQSTRIHQTKPSIP
jgi:hypothetical protein